MNVPKITRRKSIPLGVKVQSTLLLLGFSEKEVFGKGLIEWDHVPALELRPLDPQTGDTVPPANDPRYVRPLRKAAHRTKTSGRRGEKRVTSYGSDAHAIAKARRVPAAETKHREAMASKGSGAEKPCRPKRKIRSRGFEKRRKG